MIQKAWCNFCTSPSLVLNQYSYTGYKHKELCIKLGIKKKKNKPTKHKIPPPPPQKKPKKHRKDGAVKLQCPRQCTKTNHTTEGSFQCSNYKPDTY